MSYHSRWVFHRCWWNVNMRSATDQQISHGSTASKNSGRFEGWSTMHDMRGCRLKMKQIWPGNAQICTYIYIHLLLLVAWKLLTIWYSNASHRCQVLGVYWKWFWLRLLYLSRQRSCFAFFCFVRFQSQVCQNLLSSCNPTSPYRSISSHVTYFRPINFETPGGGSYSFGADNYIRAGGAEYVGVPVQATKQRWPWLICLLKAMCWCQTSNANVPGPGPRNVEKMDEHGI